MTQPTTTSEDLEIFCRQVRSRSVENHAAVRQLVCAHLPGAAIGVLRQELDSMVRVIYILAQRDRAYRERLVQDAVAGRRWKRGDGKLVSDAEMVRLSGSLHGWTKSVYEFGCSFIHLSRFHDYHTRDPFQALPTKEREQIASHLRSYHGGGISASSHFTDLIHYLPAVVDKISSNLGSYVKTLEAGERLAG